MIPEKSDPRWKRFISTSQNMSFKNVPLGLMMSRIARQTSSETSPLSVDDAVGQVYQFFIKYEKILDEDLQTIFQ